MRELAVALGKTAGFLSRSLALGAGVTWAGEIGLKIDGSLIRELLPPEAKVILIAGTNGKTTTAKLLASALPGAVLNQSGANLLNGIAGTLINSQPAKYYIFEVDENNLVEMLKQVQYDNTSVILLNLFRDQLDRYGEVDSIAKKWTGIKAKNVIINADDPQLAWLGQNLGGKVSYFGLGDKKYFLAKKQHATDSTFCPNCGQKLDFAGYYLSHLGEYECGNCGFRHPKNNLTEADYQLEGVYNRYNVLAATLVTKTLNIKPDFHRFKPAFGRMEEIGQTKILLSKNPAGFNESLRTIINSKRSGPLLLVLNDRIPDGRDISWIWDVDFEVLQKYKHPVFVSGDRKLDLALRLKYAEVPCEIKHDLNVSWILATYSAMLDIRKELTGKKIL
jgi:lipid II isoglutaminyl synthase (glutamine-hydrolysing)